MIKLRYRVMMAILLSFTCTFLKAQAPIEFLENKGQWPGSFVYQAATGMGTIFLEQDCFTYLVADAANTTLLDNYHLGMLKQPPVVKFHAYKVAFEGANTPVIKGSKYQPTYNNYFLGNDSRRWKSNIHPCLALDYTGLYNGIDMHVFSVKGNLEYEFIAAPHADISKIRLSYKGTDGISVSKGNLVIKTSVGEIKEMKPYAYQYINDNRVEIACRYKVVGDVVTYSFPDGFDETKQLVIDPSVVFATFTGSTADNWGFTATYDPEGNFYLGGLAHSLGYPVSTGAFQSTYNGGYGTGQTAEGDAYASDIAIMKFDPSGVSRIYATYIGGSGNERPHSMVVDTAHNLIIAGRSYSSDYPVTGNAYDGTYNGGWDIVVTKLNAAGSGLVGSTYIGGSADDGVNTDSTEHGYGQLKLNYGDDARSEVLTDNKGFIYVTGSTNSANFPTTGTALQNTLSGIQDGVVFKMDSTLSNLVYSTYIGGAGYDAGYVLAFNSTQSSFYVAGGTNSSNFPVTAGTLHTTYQGDSADGFILKFQNSTPYTLQKGTFVGTAHYDQVYGIQVDAENSVYVMGQSLGGQFPVTANVYSNPNSTQFIMKMDSSLATNIFSTVFGSGDATHTNISPVAFLVDTCGNIYISGWGGNLVGIEPAYVGTCLNMPITTDAAQSTTDGSDFYFIVLNKNAQALLYGSYMGQNGGVGEHVDGGTSRFDKNGIIYQAICGGCGGSSAFPTQPPGVWSLTNNSNNPVNCNEIALKIAFNIGPVSVHVSAGPNTEGCAPLPVTFTNTSQNGLSFVWDFGDGSPVDTSFNVSHSFTSPGTYHVRLSASNSNACIRVVDTGYVTIIVDSNAIKAAFTTQLVDSCGPYSASFLNTSQLSPTPAGTVFQWSFGDGSTFTGANPPVHNYPDTGFYTVHLLMTDPAACNNPDTVSHNIHFSNERVTAHFSSPDTVCQYATFTLTDSSVNATGITWYFGNGQTATSALTYHYDVPGSYTIVLIASNPGACSGLDTFTRSIYVQRVPTAGFTFQPVIPVPNDSVTFTNTSLYATRYIWDFGDQSTSTTTNPVHFYTKTGNYTVCLQAFNSSGCPAKTCKTVPTDIVPLADLPTAFTPNGDGTNDILFVRGAVITTMDLKIYNRWGELVFESTDPKHGWDGTYKGVQQEMDAYAYVLNVLFVDGTTLQKKGNVTLLR